MDMRIDPKKERAKNNGQGHHAVLRTAEKADPPPDTKSRFRNFVAVKWAPRRQIIAGSKLK